MKQHLDVAPKSCEGQRNMDVSYSMEIQRAKGAFDDISSLFIFIEFQISLTNTI